MDDILERRRLFDQYGTQVRTYIHEYSAEVHTCPCCGYPTLGQREQYDICPICDWEDDGQDDPNADEESYGANGEYSLTEARQNFVRYGIMYRPDDSRFTPPDKQMEVKRTLLPQYAAELARYRAENPAPGNKQ